MAGSPSIYGLRVAILLLPSYAKASEGRPSLAQDRRGQAVFVCRWANENSQENFFSISLSKESSPSRSRYGLNRRSGTYKCINAIRYRTLVSLSFESLVLLYSAFKLLAKLLNPAFSIPCFYNTPYAITCQ